MSLSPIVLATLAACWTLPAAFIVVRYGMERWNREDASPAPKRQMERTKKSVRIELTRSSDPSAQRQQQEVLYAGSYDDVVRSQTPPSVTELSISAPYGEVSVPVLDDSGDAALRRCSICMN